MTDPTVWDRIVKAFESQPIALALLIVIFLLYRIIQGKDVTIKELLIISKGDIERNSKVIAILEILLSRREET
jgi:hypothetical protein